MINMLKALKEDDGMTLKHNKLVTYKTGYQVADDGVVCDTVEEAVIAINKMDGSCGIWYHEQKFYIDHSFRIKTKKEALKIAREHDQISILKWSDMSLVYC